jgi:hypothetical protein
MMYPKRVAFTALLVVFHCAAQTPAELLQKGIYTQETAGDPDGALQIYRQITASAPSQSPVAAQAQFRIAEVLLRKGDLNGAAVEFNILATRYSEHQALIAKMANRLGAVHNQVTGTVRDGRYRNNRTGLELALAAPWKTTYSGPSSDDGDMVSVSDGSSVDFGVWMRPEESSAAEIPEKLRASVPAKAKMNEGTPGFAFRPESIQPRTIAGQQALSAIADYVEDGEKRAAIYTWIYTPKTHVLFLARDVPVSDVPGVQSRLDQLVSTAVVP